MGYGQALHVWGQNPVLMEVWNALSISEAIIIIPDDIHDDALASSLEILNNTSTGVQWVCWWIHRWIWLVSHAKSSEATNWWAQHLFRVNCLRSAVAHSLGASKSWRSPSHAAGSKSDKNGISPPSKGNTYGVRKAGHKINQRNQNYNMSVPVAVSVAFCFLYPAVEGVGLAA